VHAELVKREGSSQIDELAATFFLIFAFTTRPSVLSVFSSYHIAEPVTNESALATLYQFFSSRRWPLRKCIYDVDLD
jgi:hypothetical protein